MLPSADWLIAASPREDHDQLVSRSGRGLLSHLIVPCSRYHILSGPRTRAIFMGTAWITPALRSPLLKKYREAGGIDPKPAGKLDEVERNLI